MRNVTARLPGRFATPASLEGAAINQINYNLPDDYWAKYGTNMRGLTEAQLAGAGKKFVKPGEMIWLVIGDLKKIEKGVRELNYGSVIKLDSDGNLIP